MDTRKYPDAARKEAKRVTRHPLYVALQKRSKQSTADADALRTQVNDLESEVKRLRDKVDTLGAQLAGAQKVA